MVQSMHTINVQHKCNGSTKCTLNAHSKHTDNVNESSKEVQSLLYHEISDSTVNLQRKIKVRLQLLYTESLKKT